MLGLTHAKWKRKLKQLNRMWVGPMHKKK